MNLTQTGLIAAAGAAAVGAAVFVGVKIYKKSERKKNENKRAEETALKKAGEEFAAYSDKFSGLYEPLYMMAKGSMKFRPGVIGDWTIRTANLSNSDSYKDMWNSGFSDYLSWDKELSLVKINELLSFIQNTGVCRDNADEVTVDGTTYKKYSASDDEIVEAGNPAKVKTPYWFIGDRILEKGIIEKNKRE